MGNKLSLQRKTYKLKSDDKKCSKKNISRSNIHLLLSDDKKIYETISQSDIQLLLSEAKKIYNKNSQISNIQLSQSDSYDGNYQEQSSERLGGASGNTITTDLPRQLHGSQLEATYKDERTHSAPCELNRSSKTNYYEGNGFTQTTPQESAGSSTNDSANGEANPQAAPSSARISEELDREAVVDQSGDPYTLEGSRIHAQPRSRFYIEPGTANGGHQSAFVSPKCPQKLGKRIDFANLPSYAMDIKKGVVTAKSITATVNRAVTVGDYIDVKMMSGNTIRVCNAYRTNGNRPLAHVFLIFGDGRRQGHRVLKLFCTDMKNSILGGPIRQFLQNVQPLTIEVIAVLSLSAADIDSSGVRNHQDREHIRENEDRMGCERGTILTELPRRIKRSVEWLVEHGFCMIPMHLYMQYIEEGVYIERINAILPLVCDDGKIRGFLPLIPSGTGFRAKTVLNNAMGAEAIFALGNNFTLDGRPVAGDVLGKLFSNELDISSRPRAASEPTGNSHQISTADVPRRNSLPSVDLHWRAPGNSLPSVDLHWRAPWNTVTYKFARAPW